MIIHTDGTSTVNWISLRAKLSLSLGILRIMILVSFALGILMTALHILSMHENALMPAMHVSHILHVILISITFFLLAIYLYLSACIASERYFRELKNRLSVDPTVAYIEDMHAAEPIYNIFAGLLANKGIIIGSPYALRSVAFMDRLYIEGNSPLRSGYSKTLESLRKMGMTFSDQELVGSVRIALGPYAGNKSADIVITENRIAHALFLVYVSRFYVRYKRILQSLFLIAFIGAVCMVILGMYTYIFAFFAVWAGIYILFVRRAEIVTAKPTFTMMESSKPIRFRREKRQTRS